MSVKFTSEQISELGIESVMIFGLVRTNRVGEGSNTKFLSNSFKTIKML